MLTGIFWNAAADKDRYNRLVGGRRRYNALRSFRRLKRLADLAESMNGHQAPIGRLLEWGWQKQMAARFGVSEATISKDIKHLFQSDTQRQQKRDTCELARFLGQA